jgi:hypothetical protein
MSQNLNVAAVAAQLAEQDRKKIEAYQKALSVHKNLNKLPTDLAREQAAKLPPGQLSKFRVQLSVMKIRLLHQSVVH